MRQAWYPGPAECRKGARADGRAPTARRPGPVLEAYTEAWNTGDLDGIVGAYATPCFVVKEGRVLRHQDQAGKRRYFTELLAGNQRQGAHTWSIAELDPQRLGRDAALVTVRWICRRPDGSTIWEFLDSYLLTTEDGRLRILGDVVHR